jgi:hypothetical protein
MAAEIAECGIDHQEIVAELRVAATRPEFVSLLDEEAERIRLSTSMFMPRLPT